MTSFIENSFLSKLGSVTKADADAQGFGIVKLDADGKILIYNKYESELAGVPVEKAEGKNFFTDIAVCTNNRIFFGRFKDGVGKGELNLVFNYVFTYKMKPTNVVIHLYHDKSSKTNWVFVKYR
ncbi:photoactive yellow protein [Leptospira sp. GIMC2001]|uniref:photoactive yellow protein n=1 Tax=Leptospira sp. GIMC2001 TaxID=1513297 RepID=UPI00234A6470|nr:photoactive yellow protein [Leptospira sp. GIMC2001]WCL47817.1 photoactive yellow protein [Leptospira sp. GIMC2001]